MKKMHFALLSIIFILGYTNLSYELIILRQLVCFLGSNIIITSVIMAFVLLFLSWGYYLGSTTSSKKRSIRKINTRLLFALSFWYMLACQYDIMSVFFWTTEKLHAPLIETFLFSFIWLVFPSISTGFVTASIGRIIHNLNKNYTGRFMAIDTLGSVFGSLITTLIIMPLIGLSASIFALTVLTGIAAFMASHKRNRETSLFLLINLISCSFIVNIYLSHQNNPYLIKDDNASRLEIIPIPEEKSKLMIINGSNSSKISEDKNAFLSYVKFINSLISQLPQDKEHQILVLGAGAFTIGIDDERNHYTYIDVEPKLKEISEQYFLEKPLSKNKDFIVQDAYFFMLQNERKYDIIIVDVYTSKSSIPMDFVTQDFFYLSKKHLSQNGYFIANIITSPTFENAFSKRIDNTLRHVFPNYLSRQIIGNFNQSPDGLSNIIYIYHNLPEDNAVYTLDKNTAMYGQF